MGLSPDKLRKNGADLYNVRAEGNLGKRSKISFPNNAWKECYFVLYKNGLLMQYVSEENRKDDILGVKGNVMSERVTKIIDNLDSIIMEFADTRRREFNVCDSVDKQKKKKEWTDAGMIFFWQNKNRKTTPNAK